MPVPSMSSEPLTSAARICAGVLAGSADLTRPAIAPACGAAAEVPKNGFRPEPAGSVVTTPSAAAMSGLARSEPPPLANVWPGLSALIGLLLRSKNTRRGPSPLNSSTGVVGPPVNSPPPALAASTAATLNALSAALWP